MINAAVFKAFLVIDADKYIDILKKYDDYFTNFSVVNDILRGIGWLILRGLVKVSGMLNALVDKAFDFINFLDSDKFVRLFNTVRPFIWTVFLFALIYLAYCYLYAHEKPKGVMTNLLLFVGTVMILPWMMSMMNQIVSYGKDVLSSDMGENGYSLMIPYITDLVYLDSIDFDEKRIDKGERNGFTEKQSEYIRYLDINEVVDPGDYELVNEKLFKQHIFLSIENGLPKLEVLGIRKGKFYFPGKVPYYYRYHFNFFTAVVYLLCLILVMAFSSIKLVQLVYELAAEKVMAPFIAAGDLTGGQKIRKALTGILNGYITILCIFFLQKLFILSTEFINAKTWSDNEAANGMVKIVMIVAGAIFVIDGPNFFEQIFGVDAGLKSVGQALQSAYYASQMLGGVRRAAGGMAGKVKETAKSAAGTAAGAAGALSGMRDTGMFDSHNEKVSWDMMNFGPPVFDPDHALEMGRGDTPELPGGRPVLPGPAPGSSAQAGQETGRPSGNPSQGGGTGIPSGDGRQNLAGSSFGRDGEQNQNVNNAINDALNGMDSHQDAGRGGLDVSDRDNLAGWAVRNTRAGQYLKGSYDKGKSLGHAAGNTINNRNRKKENDGVYGMPEPPEQMNKDNLDE